MTTQDTIRGGSKMCSRCRTRKPTEKFGKGNWLSSGLRSECRDCRRQLGREYRKRNFIAIREQKRREAIRRRERIRTEILAPLGMISINTCEICGARPTKRLLSIDHCHKSGKIRGLLCDRCNFMLGYALDNIRILKRAISYLRERG